MKCLKNPRIKVRAQAEYAQRALELNIGHMGVLLYTLNRYFPQRFSRPVCRDFFGEYTNTVAQFGDDEEARDYMIEQQLKEMPWLSWEVAERLARHFGERAETQLDKAIYANNGFLPLFSLNLIMMLIQLRNDFGFARIRMERLINAMMTADYPEPIAWLDSIGIYLSADDDSAYELIGRLKRRDKPAATLREQLDARRELEALRAYQEEVQKA